MSRLSAPEQIVIRPTNNVYTALAGAGVVALFVGLLILYMTHKTVFGVDLFS